MSPDEVRDHMRLCPVGRSMYQRYEQFESEDSILWFCECGWTFALSWAALR